MDRLRRRTWATRTRTKNWCAEQVTKLELELFRSIAMAWDRTVWVKLKRPLTEEEKARQMKVDVAASEQPKDDFFVWPKVLERQRREFLCASLLAVYGTWQCEGDVRHLVAQRLFDLSHLLGELQTASKNFC
jgi:hypothetical protein